MRKIALISDNERSALFRNTATKMGMPEAIIEKDFWVCWMLDYLFHRSAWKNNIAFKGGTSLSKAYDLIERMSEDIDLILDWCVLGYSKDEPWTERSNTKQDIFNKEANRRTEDFLKNTFLPSIYCMANSSVKQAAFADIPLLEKVVDFKKKFYRCPWAKYEDAKVGTMKLMPQQRHIATLKNDYNHMKNMIFGKCPEFEEILAQIAELEKEINALI